MLDFSFSFFLSFFLSFHNLSHSLSLSLWLSIYCRIPQPSQPVLSVCFLAASLLRLHSPTPLFPSSRFLLVLLPPSSSSCSSVRGVQESKKERKKERFQGMGEEGRKESKERDEEWVRKKGIKSTKTGRKPKRAMKRERTRERACVFYKPSFLSSLLFSSLPFVALLSGKTFCKHKRKKNKTKQPQPQQRLWYSSLRLSRKLVGKKNRETTAATNKRSAPEDMQSARFRHHRQREREEKRKERAPRSAPKTRSLRGALVDHYAHGWRVPSLRATQIPSLRVAGIPSLRPRGSVKSFSRKAGGGRVP